MASGRPVIAAQLAELPAAMQPKYTQEERWITDLQSMPESGRVDISCYLSLIVDPVHHVVENEETG